MEKANPKCEDVYRSKYNKTRFFIIILLMATNGVLALAAVTAHHFPIGIGPVLCLTPCLQRELDLRSGLPARKLGLLEWSYILAGVLWEVAVYPLFLL